VGVSKDLTCGRVDESNKKGQNFMRQTGYLPKPSKSS